MRLDILFFQEYDIEEELPRHRTISRTKQLFPEPVFEEVFNKVFTKCVDKGMVVGHTQSVDSAMIKANALMESLIISADKLCSSSFSSINSVAVGFTIPFLKSQGHG
jgi:hypothetical protein